MKNEMKVFIRRIMTLLVKMATVTYRHTLFR